MFFPVANMGTVSGDVSYSGFSIQTGSGEYESLTSSVDYATVNEPRVRHIHADHDQSIILYMWRTFTGYINIGSYEIDSTGALVTQYTGQQVSPSSDHRACQVVSLNSASSYGAIYRNPNSSHDNVMKIAQYNTGTNQFTFSSEFNLWTADNNQNPLDVVAVSSNRFAAVFGFGASSGAHTFAVFDVDPTVPSRTTENSDRIGCNSGNQIHMGKILMTGSNAGLTVVAQRDTNPGFGARYIRARNFSDIGGTSVISSAHTTLVDSGASTLDIISPAAMNISSTKSILTYFEDSGGTDDMRIAIITHAAGVHTVAGTVSTTNGTGTGNIVWSCEMQKVSVIDEITYFLAGVGGSVMVLAKYDEDADTITILEEKASFGPYKTQDSHDGGFITPTTGSDHSTFGLMLLREDASNRFYDYITGSLS